MIKIVANLNEPQREAVSYTDGPLLVLAGAGSGKTRVITHRIAYLIEEAGIRPNQILAVTFTNKAAKEMRSRIEVLLGQTSIPWMGTFHSICARILRIELPGVGRRNDFSIIDSSDQKAIIKECFRELNVDEKKISPSTMLNYISSAKNRLKTVDQFAEEAQTFIQQMASRFYEVYQQRLQDNQAMDFDDLIMETVLLLKHHPDILEKYREMFRHVLIDEYQDVNFAQYMLVKLLSEKHGNICVVGDDDQSIYGFRGSDVSIILRFEQDFPGAKVVKLEENYRSTKVILDAANAVVKHNKGRKVKTLFTKTSGGEQISSNASMDGREEARYIVREIKKWREKEMKFSDFVILYRANSHSRSIEDVFKQEGINYDIVGGLRFYERAEIKDAIAYLKLLANPSDYLSFRRIINVPSRGIGTVTQDKIISESIIQKKSLTEIMQDASNLPRIGKKIQTTLSEFAVLIELLREEKDKMSVSDLIDKVLKDVGYFEWLKAEEDPRKFERMDNLDELISDAKEFEISSPDRSVEAFLERVALYTDIDEKKEPTESDEGKVTLMTIHSAKGLEFPIVFISGLEEGVFPHFRCIEEGTEAAIEEERRLFYVAMTRARKKLYLTYARERTLHGKTHHQSPSRFLREVPEEYIDRYMPEIAHRSFIRKVPSVLDKTLKEESGRKDKYCCGDQVYHKIFGIGTVKSSDKGYVTAEFSSHGVKILSQEFLNPYEQEDCLKPGDRVVISGGPEGVLKRHEGNYAYIILSGGDVEKFEKDRVTVKKD